MSNVDTPTAHGPSVGSTPQFASVAGVNVNEAEDGEYLYKRHLVEFIDQPELIGRPIDNKARMTYIGTDVSNINVLVRQHFGAHIETADVYHFPTNRIPQQLTCHQPADRIPLDAFQLPSKAVVDDLLQAYFRSVNPGFPVVDEHIFMQQYQARDPDRPPSLVLLQAMLVAGAHVLYSNDQEQRNSSKAIFFRRAKSLLDVRFERNRDTIVQAALLLTWHTEGVEDVAANAWFWLGIAVRTATGLGMHRDADNSTLVSFNKRMWRRVWWLLFMSDVWISVQYGRPQSIHLEDSNVQSIKKSDFDDCGDDIRCEYMMEMSKLAVIVSKALRARSRASTMEGQLEALRKTDAKLASWALKLPQKLHLHTTSKVDIWTANLHIHYNTALIVLHRSLPLNGIGNKEHDNSKICASAAGIVQSLFQRLRENDGLKCLWMSTINCLFSALIQLSLEIQLSNPILAISALRSYDSALISMKQLAEYWPNAKAILHFFEKSVRINSPQEDGLNETMLARDVFRPQNSSRTSTQREMNQGKSPSCVPMAGNPPEFDPDQARDSAEAPLLSPSIKNASPSTSQESMSWILPPMPQDLGVNNLFNGTEEMLDAWKQWQSQNWNSPDFSDGFLFTF